MVKRQTITALRKHGKKKNNYSCKKTWYLYELGQDFTIVSIINVV